MTKTITAYKLFKQRKNKTLGPLFINARQIIPLNKWLPAEDHPTKGFAPRMGWHAAHAPFAPHLSTKGRVWAKVELQDVATWDRPASQGGQWLIAQRIRVLKLLTLEEQYKINLQLTLATGGNGAQ